MYFYTLLEIQITIIFIYANLSPNFDIKDNITFSFIFSLLNIFIDQSAYHNIGTIFFVDDVLDTTGGVTQCFVYRLYGETYFIVYQAILVEIIIL